MLPAHSSVPGSGVRGGVCGGVLLSPLHLNSYPSCSDATLELSIRHARLLEIPSHVWISAKVRTLHVFTLMAERGNAAISPTPLHLQPLLRPVCPFSGAQVAPLLPLKHFTHGYISNCRCSAAQCCPTLLTPWTAACQSIFHSIRVFPSESALHIRCLKYWSFSFSISPSPAYSGLISFRIDWCDFFAVHGILKSFL